MVSDYQVIDLDTCEGPVRGTVADGVAAFRGIPFAQPPVGPLRFRPPVPPMRRAGTLDATGPARVCPQPPLRLFHALGDPGGVQDEAALEVSIWAPLPTGRKRPVLVWIHGGALVSGSASLPWYDGARLARENDIVVVGLNYRLGALGFLHLPGLVEGNMGLLDQIQALEWLRLNVASFGGDPEQMTLMGQSAGALTISCILATPQMRGRFKRAIFLSGGGKPLLQTRAQASAVAERFCAKLGVDPQDPDALQQLQSLPVSAILDAQIAVIRETPRAPGEMMPLFVITESAPITDGGDFSEACAQALGDVDVIVGTTGEEMRIFEGLDPRTASLTFADLPMAGEALFGAAGPALLDRARRARPGASPARILNDAYTISFVDGVRRVAAGAADAGRNAWLFRFDWRAPQSDLGACHCIDLPFVFGTFDTFEGARILAGADRSSMEALSRTIRSAIGRFVINGSPDGEDLPEWPRFSLVQPVLMAFDNLLSLGWLGATDV